MCWFLSACLTLRSCCVIKGLTGSQTLTFHWLLSLKLMVYSIMDIHSGSLYSMFYNIPNPINGHFSESLQFLCHAVNVQAHWFHLSFSSPSENTILPLIQLIFTGFLLLMGILIQTQCTLSTPCVRKRTLLQQSLNLSCLYTVVREA